MKGVAVAFGGLLALALAVFFYRLPQAALTWAFPNDYLYRFRVSATFEGERYDGESASGCRVQRSPFPDAMDRAFGTQWKLSVWATPLIVPLSGGRFLFFPPLNVASCLPTPDRPDPAWKEWLGLVPLFSRGAGPPIEPFPLRKTSALQDGPVILADGNFHPKQMLLLSSSAGADAVGLRISPIAVGRATWQDVQANLAGAEGSFAIPSAVQECMVGTGRGCPFEDAFAYTATRLSLGEAMQVPAFAKWAEQANRAEALTAVSADWRPVLGIVLGQRFGSRAGTALVPDWSTGRWIATGKGGVAHAVGRMSWPGDLSEPTLCTTAERCATSHAVGTVPVFVDWEAGEVFVIRSQMPVEGRVVFRGEAP